jgi:DNA invertase Pin-like site-specific DNA recombinase
MTRGSAAGTPNAPASVWLIYIRRSYKKMGSDKVVSSADTSDEVQLERCLTMLPTGVRSEVIADSGGHQSGRGEKRDGWQAVIRRVELGGIAGIVAYDVSRLARNARLVLNLHHALEETGAQLKVVQVPDARFSTPEGRFQLGILALAAQFQGDYDEKRMTDMARATFEGGGHVGNDPFGYRTVRDERGAIVRPRTLAIIESEAEVVRRVWRDLVSMSTAEIARTLQAEGVRRRTVEPWTKDAVKDIVRRGRFYIGKVVYRRGEEERDGRHRAILDETTWAAGRKAADARLKKTDQSSRAHRIYLLTGILVCVCGRRLHGQTRSSRSHEWMYYLCRGCGRKAIATKDADKAVLDRLRQILLPPAIIEAGRDELRRRLALPSRGASDELRSRLELRLERLKTQFGWGDIEAPEYRAKMQETQSELALLPDPDKVVTFDGVGAVVESLRAALDSARPEQVRELIGLLIERVKLTEDGEYEIEPIPAARPFFAAASDLLLAPPDGLKPPIPTQRAGLVSRGRVGGGSPTLRPRPRSPRTVTNPADPSDERAELRSSLLGDRVGTFGPSDVNESAQRLEASGLPRPHGTGTIESHSAARPAQDQPTMTRSSAEPITGTKSGGDDQDQVPRGPTVV